MEDKRKAWGVIFNETQSSPNSLRHCAIKGHIPEHGLRSVYWKIFLEYLPVSNVSGWSTLLSKERQRYTDLKRKYIQEPLDPLLLNDEQYSEDILEIKIIIQQDVERTFPSVEYFRDSSVQQCLANMLFIYSQLNPDISYRQGMHELLAPFYWVVALDSINTNQNLESDIMSETLDSAYIEHDTFCLFEKLMYHGKSWYEFKEKNTFSKNSIDSSESSEYQLFNPVVLTCQRIHHEYLSIIDPQLYQHLEDFGIEPQLYGLRWIRLMFGREFDLHELLKLWDAIFAHDSTFQIVEYICLVILLYLRDQLLQKDYTECLCLLMNPVSVSLPASLFFEQARYLQEEPSQAMALRILQEHDTQFNKKPRKRLNNEAAIPQGTIKQKVSTISIMGKAFTSVIGTVHKNMTILTSRSQRQKVHPLVISSNPNMNELMAQYIHVLESEIFGKQDEANIMAALAGLKHVRETVFENQPNPSVTSSFSDEWEVGTPESTLFGSVSEMTYDGYEMYKPLPPIIDDDPCSEWINN